MRKRVLAGIFLLGCSSSDPGTLDARRASLGPGGSVSSGDTGASSVATSGSGTGTSSGAGQGAASGSGSGGGASGSGSSSGGGSATSSSGSGDATATGDDAGSSDVLQRCIDDINSYRATINVPAYTRSSSLEAFAAAGAESDGQSGSPHGHFISTNGGNGVAFAENEVPGWPLAQYGTVADILDQGMQMMWAEGPGGGHYDNMASTQYTQAGCGTYTTSDGNVWITTDFR